MENKKPNFDQKLCSGCEEPAIDKVPPCPLQCRAKQCKAYQSKVCRTTNYLCIYNPHMSDKILLASISLLVYIQTCFGEDF